MSSLTYSLVLSPDGNLFDLQLKCSARIHDIYAQESEKLIEEDRPRILASGRSPDMNMYPFDQPGDADEHNELFLTHKSE